MMDYALLLFFPFLMLYAAFSDMLTMTISNKVSLLLIIGFGIFAFYVGMPFDEILWHIAVFSIVLCIGIAMFSFGLLGGGDAKLAASTALWLGSYTYDYIFISTILGAGLGIFLLLIRSKYIPQKIASIGWVNRLYQDKTGMPYGLALGAGAIIVYPNTLWMQHIVATAIAN